MGQFRKCSCKENMDLAEYYTSVFYQAVPAVSSVCTKQLNAQNNNTTYKTEPRLCEDRDSSSYPCHSDEHCSTYLNYPDQLSFQSYQNQTSSSFNSYSNQHSPSSSSYPSQHSPSSNSYPSQHSSSSNSYPSQHSPSFNEYPTQCSPSSSSYPNQHSPSSIIYSSQQSPHYPSQHSPGSDYGSLSDSPVPEEQLSPSINDSTLQSYSDVSSSIKKKSRNSSTKSSKVPKIPALEVLQKRRLAANGRERKRMTSINQGFDRLRKVLPGFKDRDLSKFESLQMATSYILELAEILKSQ